MLNFFSGINEILCRKNLSISLSLPFFLFSNYFNNPILSTAKGQSPQTIRSAGRRVFFPRRDANASRLSNHRRQLPLPRPVGVVREILIPSTSFRGTPGTA